MLEDIIEYKINETKLKLRRRTLQSIKELLAQTENIRPVRDFKSALTAGTISLIPEIKRKSPSKGVLRENFDPIELAASYQRAGASAISVLGDEHFFAGGADVVKSVATSERIEIPVMFKDFICSEYQMYEARACSADAVLLIVRILDQKVFEDLLLLSKELGMAALVETFDEEDVDRAIAAGSDIIGINNRNLDTFKTNFSRTEKLISKIPGHVTTVSESGINTREDVRAMAAMGFDAMLVGESIIIQKDVEQKIAELLND